ncbi:monooxygenase-like protein [Cordyceps javanica]|nr:monooxygenase-like protein [Cordyceps javanica]
MDKAITWNQAGDVNFFRERFKNWNPVVKRLAELTPDVRLFPNYAGPSLSTWLPAPRVALLGDAAHTHGGAFAAGGSLALDDALALGLALRYVFESRPEVAALQLAEIQHALTLYDRTRQPHAAKLLSIIHNAPQKTQSPDDNEEADDESLIMRLKSRPDLTWLSEHDVEAAFAKTVRELQQIHQNHQPKGPIGMASQYESKL